MYTIIIVENKKNAIADNVVVCKLYHDRACVWRVCLQSCERSTVCVRAARPCTCACVCILCRRSCVRACVSDRESVCACGGEKKKEKNLCP